MDELIDGEFMKAYFAFLLFFFATSCSVQNSAQMTNLSNENNGTISNKELGNSSEKLPVSVENQRVKTVKSSNTLDCNNPDSYSLEIVEDFSRKLRDTVTRAKILNVVLEGEIFEEISLPTQSEFNGYSLRFAKKTKDGFEIKVEFGSRMQVQKLFTFVCKDSGFYLKKTKTEIRDKQRPELWGKPERKEAIIVQMQSIEEFSIFDYLVVD